jgi:dihydrofolate synthase/folylpolyglutamate synthase
VAALVTVLADKDWRGMLRALAPVVDRFVLSTAPTAPSGRVWHPEEALAFARGEGWTAEIEPDFDRALAIARQGAATTLITGSFHTVGDAMARLQVAPLPGYIA